MLSRRAVLGGALAASMVGTVSCRSRNPTTIRVGYLPISESLPLFAARAGGFFDREGLTVEPVPLDGGAIIISAMTGGSLEFGLSNYVSQMLARERQLDVRLISGSTVETRQNPQHVLLVKQNSPLRPTDLAGKNIAVNTRRNINELFVRAFLGTVGVDPNSVNFVEIPFPRMLTALESGAIDVAGCIEPFVTFGRNSGVAKPIGRFVVDVEDRVPIAGWVALGQYVQRNRDLAERFKRVIGQAIIEINANQSAARSLLPSFTSLREEDARATPLPTFVGETPPRTLPRLIERVRQAGWIQTATRVEDYVFTQ